MDNATAQRFWAKVDVGDTCWLWTGAKSKGGYGQIRIAGTLQYAHRLMVTIVEADPGSNQVDHICHNRSCVRPSHLRIVTDKQNNENREGANRNSKSGVRGVYFCNTWNSWFGSVMHNRRKYAKKCATAEEAAEWCRLKRLELFTHSDLDRTA